MTTESKPMKTPLTLGVIGLGSMGCGAALTALARGVTTWGLDLNPAACATVAQAGGRIAADVAELSDADGLRPARGGELHADLADFGGNAEDG